jgi:hypothetical protein
LNLKNKSNGKRQKSKVRRAALDLRNSEMALLPNPTFAFSLLIFDF